MMNKMQAKLTFKDFRMFCEQYLERVAIMTIDGEVKNAPELAYDDVLSNYLNLKAFLPSKARMILFEEKMRR